MKLKTVRNWLVARHDDDDDVTEARASVLDVAPDGPHLRSHESAPARHGVRSRDGVRGRVITGMLTGAAPSSEIVARARKGR